MKLGLSTYSLCRAVAAGELSVPESVAWIAENGGEHVEVTPLGYDLAQDDELLNEIIRAASKVGLPISNYSITANFLQDNKEAYDAEISRVLKHVDIAGRLGASFMRHDVAFRPPQESSIARFEEDLQVIVQACRMIADYAAPFGITTSIENHGYYVQASDRIQRIMNAVDRHNFKTTLDIGNFLCVDEDPVAAVKKNIAYASVIHLKDFYVRPSYHNPGEGWFQSSGGNYLRGAILGQGDMDMREILRVVKRAGYDGYIAIEFEGMENCLQASRIALENAKRLWQEV